MARLTRDEAWRMRCLYLYLLQATEDLQQGGTVYTKRERREMIRWVLANIRIGSPEEEVRSER